jgi:protein SCO1/2
MSARLILAGVACLALLALPAAAQSRSPVLPEVGYDQLVGRRLPLSTPLRDESGTAVRLGELLAGRPAVLVFAYYHCPMLCPVVLDGFAGSLAAVGLDAGRDFEVVVVSFDPKETPAQAAAMQRKILGDYGRPAAGWHFTTAGAPAVAALTRAAGFRYQRLPERDEFAHAAGFVVLTPEGRIARYLFGLEPAPRDLRLALVEAGRGRIGTVVDQVLLYCFHYDPATGRYSATILNLVRLAAAATVLGLVALVVTLRRRETAPGPRPPALEALDR